MALDYNPYSILYNGLCNMVKANDNIANIANLISGWQDYAYSSAPIHPNEITESRPELRIIPKTGLINIYDTSSSTKVERFFEFQLNSGKTANLADIVLPLEWEILRAFADWEKQLLSLQYYGDTFVKLVNLDNFNEGVAQGRDGVTNWAFIARIKTQCFFQTTKLFLPRAVIS